MVIRIFLVQPNGSILILNTMVRNHFVQNYNVTIGSKKNIKHSQNIKKKHKSNILAKLVKTHIFVKHFFLKIQSSILDFLASKHFVFFSSSRNMNTIYKRVEFGSIIFLNTMAWEPFCSKSKWNYLF